MDDLRGEPDDVASIYGDFEQAPAKQPTLKIDFKPWHHPVKQIVRESQWAALAKRLGEASVKANEKIVKYFTLPGADLLDVRCLGKVLAPLGLKIEYFGFDSSRQSSSGSATTWATAESALRQSGIIGPDALILPDRLEDIAIEKSQAAAQLAGRAPFNIVNLDLCGHLTHSPIGRTATTFDALKALLKHQVFASRPWLLFVTTRVDKKYLGAPANAFKSAVVDNIRSDDSGTFAEALSAAIKCDRHELEGSLTSAWTADGEELLKVYAIGIAKYLLQFFNGQPNCPADVALTSGYAYRVRRRAEPDMLSLAFRIAPRQRRTFDPNSDGAIPVEPLEIKHAIRAVDRIRDPGLWDLDAAMAGNANLANRAEAGTRALLEAAQYSVTDWEKWREAFRSDIIGVRDDSP